MNCNWFMQSPEREERLKSLTCQESVRRQIYQKLRNSISSAGNFPQILFCLRKPVHSHVAPNPGESTHDWGQIWSSLTSAICYYLPHLKNSWNLRTLVKHICVKIVSLSFQEGASVNTLDDAMNGWKTTLHTPQEHQMCSYTKTYTMTTELLVLEKTKKGGKKHSLDEILDVEVCTREETGDEGNSDIR